MDPLLRLYLLLFPVSHVAVIPVAGARAALSDLLLVVFVVAWAIGGAMGRVVDGRDSASAPTRRRLAPPGPGRPVFFLVGYGVFVTASGLWGFHPDYALVKGAGALALGVTLLCPALGPGPRGVVNCQGGASPMGLPRVAGTFGPPNLFGDWLAVSGVLLWARWPGGGEGRAVLPGSVTERCPSGWPWPSSSSSAPRRRGRWRGWRSSSSRWAR